MTAASRPLLQLSQGPGRQLCASEEASAYTRRYSSKPSPSDSNMGMAMISQTLAFDDRKLNGEPGPTDGRILETEPRQLDVSRTKFVKQVAGPDRKLNGEPVQTDGRMETEPRWLDVSHNNLVKQVTGSDRKLNGEPAPTDHDGRMETEPRRVDVSRTNSVKQVTGPPLVLPAPAGGAVEQGSKPQAVTTVDGLAKKKARKRLSEDSGLVGSKDHGDIKKKKRKKVLGTDDNARDIQKKKKKKVLGIGHRHGEISRIESQRRDAGVVRVSDLMSSAASQPPRADPNSLGLEFPELLSDLRVLAVDPLFGTERDAPKIVLQVSCKFRTKVEVARSTSYSRAPRR